MTTWKHSHLYILYKCDPKQHLDMIQFILAKLPPNSYRLKRQCVNLFCMCPLWSLEKCHHRIKIIIMVIFINRPIIFGSSRNNGVVSRDRFSLIFLSLLNFGAITFNLTYDGWFKVKLRQKRFQLSTPINH